MGSPLRHGAIALLFLGLLLPLPGPQRVAQALPVAARATAALRGDVVAAVARLDEGIGEAGEIRFGVGEARAQGRGVLLGGLGGPARQSLRGGAAHEAEVIAHDLLARRARAREAQLPSPTAAPIPL